jgi:dihydroxyacid dehydratase/phosphogluconate dehydratase
MNCKFCNAELPEGLALCPACGKDNAEEIVTEEIAEEVSEEISEEELAARPQQPLKRNRVVSKALRAYAQSVSSADKGGVRIID